MKEFTYVIKDTLGIHARPAGSLVKIAQSFEATIRIHAKSKVVDVKKLMAIMSVGIKQNDSVTIQADGTDEEEAIARLEEFFQSTL